MSQPQTFNGVVYSIPVQGDLKWGPALTRYLAALGTYAISPAGGTYTLTSDLNLGASFGVIAAYFKSASANLATAGLLRLAHSDAVEWRNNANSGNLALTTNASDQLVFNGSVLNTLTLPVSVSNGGTGVSSLTTYAVLLGGTTTTGAVQDAGTGSNGQVLTSQGPGAKPIWSASGTGSGTVNTGTANQLAYYASSTNAVSGLTAITASKALVSDTNGLPVAATTTTTELNFVSGVTSAIQTQINTKAPTASPTFTGTVTVPNGVGPTTAAAFGQIGGTAGTNAAGYILGTILTIATGTTTASGGNQASFTDTGLSASITLKSATSKVRISISQNGTAFNSGQLAIQVLRTATSIFSSVMFEQNANSVIDVALPIFLYDSPATTGSVTYKTQYRNAGSGSVAVQNLNETSTIILEEIAQ